MEFKKSAVAGTLESSDIMITIEQGSGGSISVDLDSSVQEEFGPQITEVIITTAESLGLTGLKITAVDKGALDCTIRARVQTAVHRACEDENYDWTVS